MLSVEQFITLGAILFCIGLYGALTKRNIIIVLVSVELMLNAVNINLLAFSRFGLMPSMNGQIFTLFAMTIAAAEVAVGLAILISLYRNRNTSDVRDQDLMKW
ncbi:NADH-quinone oxidoreductase subunit K [Tumebacillus algifaecis]|uniref:NADH-quinone oxidoreductase subunit K n=1 Tax=Tumebacillus algifaecis TaxID=1214604 RepID=A0A223CXN1_9BACL|nr:NADH-quinone oxidoreductase subunit NuoK [Tumebacillus algifaecis]ASS73863.1 NADH-quinone oxidoreductase subunit K [Tumebacillus algifaecis]